MNIKEIELVSKLENYTSFSDAAYNLFYTPSVVTKYVMNVEKELGIKVFSRGNKSNDLMITPEGRVIIQDLKQITLTYQHMMETANQLREADENMIRIGSQGQLFNVVEHQILSRFLAENPTTEIERIKTNSDSEMEYLLSGSLDGMFAAIHQGRNVEEYFRSIYRVAELDSILLCRDNEMYLGISTQYLPTVTEEATFGAFCGFTFAFSFPKSEKMLDATAIAPFERLAKKNGFDLKTAYYGTQDMLMFDLTKTMKLAIVTSRKPKAVFPGVKFIRVSDWTAFVDMYFLSLKSNHRNILSGLKTCISQYLSEN